MEIMNNRECFLIFFQIQSKFMNKTTAFSFISRRFLDSPEKW